MYGLIENCIYRFLYCIYYAFYLAGLVAVKVKLAYNELKLQTGWHFIYQGIMKPISKRSKVSDIGLISTKEEIDFLTHRSPGYLERMFLWTAKELAKLAVRRQTIGLISDTQLSFVLLHTVFAHNLKWDEHRKMFSFDMSEMSNYTLFEGFYWEAKRVYVDPETSKITIVMRNDQEYHSDCSLQHKPEYDFAKLHLQICLSYYAPGLAHYDVHFVFPSAICLAAKTSLEEDSVLYQLLSPHFRFMERLNFQALRVCHASSNNRTLFDRYFSFWKPFPVTKEQFLAGIEGKLKNHFITSDDHDNYLYLTETKLNDHFENKLISNKRSFDKNSMSSSNQLFPPAYVKDKSAQKIPYLNFLSQYYEVIRGFVTEIAPFVNKQEWDEVSQYVSRYVTCFEHVDMVEGLSTFIYLVSVVHSADHRSYLDFFANKYGCISIRTPFEPFTNERFWSEIQTETGFPVEEVKRNPTVLIKQRDVMRMRCFLNVFVDYIPSPRCDLSLLKTNYRFKKSDIDSAARNFISNLRCLDGILKIQSSFIDTATSKGDPRPTGMQLVKLENFVRSNCF